MTIEGVLLELSAPALFTRQLPTDPLGCAIHDLSLSRDFVHGGAGAIHDTVEQQATPSNIPLRRRVRLLREVDYMPLRETWSDAATGAYSFSDLDPAYTYIAIARDHLGIFRAAAADKLTPVVAQVAP